MSTWRSPVGDGTSVWGDGWVDANPIGTRYQLGSGYSIHTGADLNWNTPVWNADDGAPCYACADGVVTYSSLTSGSWGNLVVIIHDDELYSRYGHLRERVVREGDFVTTGDLVGYIGGTGGHTPHLHFDISITDVLGRYPEHWPGDNRALVSQHYTGPKQFILERMSEDTDMVDKATLDQIETHLAAIGALVDDLRGEDTTPEPEPGPTYDVMYVRGVAPQTLRVRVGPGTQYSIASGLPEGTRVTVYERRNGWARIGSNEWVYAGYLDFQ